MRLRRLLMRLQRLLMRLRRLLMRLWRLLMRLRRLLMWLRRLLMRLRRLLLRLWRLRLRLLLLRRLALALGLRFPRLGAVLFVFPVIAFIRQSLPRAKPHQQHRAAQPARHRFARSAAKEIVHGILPCGHRNP
jgi:hypothetical protein